MRTNSVLVAALVAAASVASAEEAPRPKIYFPRQVKRQFLNMTLPTESPTTSTSPFTLSETTKRDSISDMLASLTQNPTFTDKPSIIRTPTTDPSGSDSTGPTPPGGFGPSGSRFGFPPGADTTDPGSSGSAGGATTVIIETTIVVPPSPDPSPTSNTLDGVGSTGGIPPTIVQPTAPTSAVGAPESASPTDSASPSATASDSGTSETGSPSTDLSGDSSSSSGILLAPTGVVTPTTASQVASSTASQEASATATDPLGAIGSLTSSAVSDLTSAILPTANGTDTTDTPAATTTPTEAPASPTVDPTATTPPTDPTASGSTTADPTTATADPTSSDHGIDLSLTLFPPTSTVVNSTPSVTDEPTTSPTDIIVLPSITNGTDSGIPTSTPPSTESTVSGGPSSSVTEPPTTVLDPTNPPVTGNATLPDPSPTSSTSGSVGSGTDNTTTEPTGLPTVSVVHPNVTSVVNTTSPETVVPPSPTTTLLQSTLDTSNAVTSIVATATQTGADSSTWLPTTIIVDQPPTSTPTLNPTASASALPSTLPKAITPTSGTPDAPPDTVQIGISFKHSLNYEFLTATPGAAQLVFTYAPVALQATGEFPNDSVVMIKLVPLNTNAQLGYTTTVALFSYPQNMVDELQLQVRTPSSALYNTGPPIVNNLTQQINSAIPIMDWMSWDAGAAGGGSGSGADAPGSSGNGPAGDPFSNAAKDGPPKPGQAGTMVGIAFGAAGVAAAYGATMFIIARRYKKKKQAHRRASSMTNPSEMTSAPGSPHLMNGALLSRDFSSYGGVAGGRNSHGTQNSGRSGANNSGRTAYISGPMAAENSLGWN